MAALVTFIMALIEGALSATYVLVLLVAGPLSYGYFLYLNRQVDYKQQDLNLLFEGFTKHFAQSLIAGLLISLSVGIGCLLLFVPGIILACGFSMTYLIMIDRPEMSGVDAMKASWNLMKGQKWSYFCLCFRYIGWILLSLITFGILMMWIQPYMYTAQIGFYRKVCSQNATAF